MFPSPVYKVKLAVYRSLPCHLAIFFYDKLNGMFRVSIQEMQFPRQSNQLSWVKYQLQFYISQSICTCYILLTYRHSIDFGERV